MENSVNIGAWGGRPPAICKRDLGLLAYLSALAGMAWLLPEPRWDSISRRIARFTRALRPHVFERDVRQLAMLLDGRVEGADVERLLEKTTQNHHRSRLECLRCYHPRGWSPDLRLEGREHVDDALARGRGGVLWVAPISAGELATKMTFAAAGYQVSHLSRIHHGFSATRFGVGVLNPIWTRVERRYLAERLEMSAENSVHALKMLIGRVRANRLVSITAGRQGVRGQAVPFLNGTLHLADGPPALARKTGAALLPVFTVRVGPGAFVTTVEPPLDLGTDAQSRDFRPAHLQYAALLASHLLRQPENIPRWWLGGGLRMISTPDLP